MTLALFGFAIGTKYWPRMSFSLTSLLAARYTAVAAPSWTLCPMTEKTFLNIEPISFPRNAFQAFHCSVTMFPGKKALT